MSFIVAFQPDSDVKSGDISGEKMCHGGKWMEGTGPVARGVKEADKMEGGLLLANYYGRQREN